MSRTVLLPPADHLRPDGTALGGWWHDDPETGRIICDLCPRACSLKDGDRGFCFVRQNIGGEMILTTYGRSTGFCVDPIEKKPLNHFLPGTSVLSFGTAGCNLGCKFCQNWDISKSREVERLSSQARPDAIVETARQLGCRSVAYTYNDPIIWAEYAIDTARACRAAGIQNVAVTAGYISPDARKPFFEFMDAANVDLKAFTEDFYQKITYSHLQPVLETIEYLKRETDVWFEITNLVIPGANDSMDEIRRMCSWILHHCGPDVPLHFSAFHPDFRMKDRPPTPPETLVAARETAIAEGLHFVYTGNVEDVKRQSTYCPNCGEILIERNWYELGLYNLRGNRCGKCSHLIPGRFEDRPGTWGRRRLPVDVSRSTNNSRSESSRISSPPRPQASHSEAPTNLSESQKVAILKAANELVAAYTLGTPPTISNPTVAGAASLPVLGIYVTLKRAGRLRGCCGSIGRPRPLLEALVDASHRSACNDPRVPPLAPVEIPFLDLHVNVLRNLQRVTESGRDRLSRIEVGRHGLRIERKGYAGLLLPSVAVEHQLDAESFLRHVCRKAGLPTTAWQDDETQLWTFEGIEFGGPFDYSILPPDSFKDAGLFSTREFLALAEHAHHNVLALIQGRAPRHYLPGSSDQPVAGLALSTQLSGKTDPITLAKLSLRPGLPLQSTLYQLSESMAHTLSQIPEEIEVERIDLAAFTSPATQGTFDRPDLRGFDPTSRTLLAIDRDHTAFVFSPECPPEQLVEQLRSILNPSEPESVGLYSLVTQTTSPRFLFSNMPRPDRSRRSRPPAVAGTFYPANPSELERLVEEMLSNRGNSIVKSDWPAILVPHAGLIYSGPLAAATFQRVEIPELTIVLGPKHTRLGVDWAVAPHDNWSIPGAMIPNDLSVAHELAKAIPGLELDAAAHQYEHAIEVELPFLARLAPHTRVVGITVGTANWNRCREFARGLADVISRLPSPPLLVISSDMNHFATDAETRRLDEIALRALETLDPHHLLSVVREHNISMCGVLPAVIVMETLRLMGKLTQSERVGHTTSAEVSGDTSRVVGYAGLLLR